MTSLEGTEPAGDAGGIMETPDLEGAYPRLDDAQLAALDGLGQRRPARPGEVLVQEGDRDCAFLVILAGHVSVIDGHGTSDERVIGVHGRGRFLGELGLLTGESPFYTATAADPGEVLAMPAGRLRELVSQDPSLGDLILRAYLIRRSLLIGLGGGVRVVGSRYSPDVRRVREFMARNRIPARWLDLEADPAADALLAQFGVAPEETPILIVHGQLLRNPGNAQLAATVGLPVPSAPYSSCDLLVVGAGPAGLSAAVYGASEGMRVIVLDAVATGGQAGASSRIENYLGFPSGISGDELTERAVLQARKFGAQFAVPAEAMSIKHNNFDYVVQLDDGTSITAASVVVATGCRYRRLDVPRLDHFEKTSVYYAASQAEAPVCDGIRVVVVGGGNSAGQAAVFLSRHAAQVIMVVRERELDEYMSRYLIDQIERPGNVDVMLSTEVRELRGDQALEGVIVEDRQTGERRTLGADALFVFVGVIPCTGWLGDLVALDDDGFVRTGSDAVLARGASPESVDGWRHLTLETSEPGIFAVGDVRSGSARRVAAAVGEGAMAIRLAMERTRSALGQCRARIVLIRGMISRVGDPIELRPATANDLPMIEALTWDPEIAGKFAQFGWFNPRLWRQQWAENELIGEDGGVLVVAREGERLGFMNWRRKKTTPGAWYWEIGIALLPQARGHGYGTRAHQLLVRYLFAHTTAHRIEASTEAGNVAEQKALEKAGFTREGVIRATGWRDGAWRNGIIYGILRTDPAR